MAAKGRTAATAVTIGATSRMGGVPEAALPERKKIAAADFYGALQRNLNALQRQLSSANNAFPDFVVKEFKIDAAVQMNVNELGVLQLVFADDTMTALSVSRISLTLGAVAKAQYEPLASNMARAELTALTDLTWLPPTLVEQLAGYEVKTAAEFLGLVADARFATQIASLLKVQRADIGRWASQMRLLELPGMTAQTLAALGELKIYAVADLAQLGEKDIVELQKKAPKTLTVEILAKWRDAAKQLLS